MHCPAGCFPCSSLPHVATVSWPPPHCQGATRGLEEDSGVGGDEVAVMLWQIGCLAQTEAELVIRHGAPASCIAYVCGEVGKPCPLPGLAFVSFSPSIKTALGYTVDLYDRYNPRPPSMTTAPPCHRIRRSAHTSQFSARPQGASAPSPSPPGKPPA